MPGGDGECWLSGQDWSGELPVWTSCTSGWLPDTPDTCVQGRHFSQISFLAGAGVSCDFYTGTVARRGSQADKVSQASLLVINLLFYRSYKEIAGLNYEEFLDYVSDLNEISSHFLDANGKQLVFAVKKGTDSTALWKGTVRIAFVKVSKSIT